MDVLGRILKLLEESGIPYRHVHHAETYTSEESARARGEPLAFGAKAIVMKVDAAFVLLVMSAARRLDSAKIREHFSARKTRFATPTELLDLTGLVPGSVPPFGAPILDLPLYADSSVFENDRVAFNAGSLTESIILSSSDYRRVANAVIFPFTKAAAPAANRDD